MKRLFLWLALVLLTLTELYLCFVFVGLNDSPRRVTLALSDSCKWGVCSTVHQQHSHVATGVANST